MFVPLLTVLVIVLAVVIGCVLMRYKKKCNPSAVAANCVPNNATAIAAVKKEKELNEDAFDSLTYNKLRQNDYCNLLSQHKDNVSAIYEVPGHHHEAPGQHYEVPDQHYDVPYDDEEHYEN